MTVRVTSSAPSEAHWVAAYAPADADVTATAPVKYAVVAEADGYYGRKHRDESIDEEDSPRAGVREEVPLVGG